MGKQKKGKSAKASSKSSKAPYELILGIVAIVAAVAIYFYSGRNTSSPAMQQMQQLQEANPVPSDYLAKHPNLRNRLILPAIPQETRPITLPPESFTDDEIRRSYQAAKDHPEVLETVSCYCGCYGSAGHRNNLDCYRDNHGITWALCRAIALEAQRQYQLGTPIADIKPITDEKYAPRLR